MTATLVRSLSHNGLMVQAQGNQQILPDGDPVVGWGSGSAPSDEAPTVPRLGPPSRSGGRRQLWPGYTSGADATRRIRTADPFITRTPRRLRLVAVRGAEDLVQANFGRFAP